MIYLGAATLIDDQGDRYLVHAGIKWVGDRNFTGTLGANLVWDVVAERALRLELPARPGGSNARVTATVVVDAIVDNEAEVRGLVYDADAEAIPLARRPKAMGGVVKLSTSR